MYRGEVLCNCIEGTEWSGGNPVQVSLCEECGCEGCSDAGYVRISRIGDSLLWTRSFGEASGEAIYDRHTALTALGRFGAVRIPLGLWADWRVKFKNLPEAEGFPRANRSDILDAWLLEVPAPFRTAAGFLWHDTTLHPIDRAGHTVALVRNRLLACEHAAVDSGRNSLDAVVAWARSAPEQPVDGDLITPRGAGVNIETLFLESARTEEWSALSQTGDGIHIAFGTDTILVPPIIET